MFVEDESVDLQRRDFLLRFCQGAGAMLVPVRLWGSTFFDLAQASSTGTARSDVAFQVVPHYRSQRPVDATLLQVQAGLDDFPAEKFAEQIAGILRQWSESLLRSPRETQALRKVLAADFSGTALPPAPAPMLRSGLGLEVRENKLAGQTALSGDAFLREWQARLTVFADIVTAEFQITRIDAAPETSSASPLPG